ncbi:MAG: hypothetical protein RBQ97_11130 [Acholeplasma sp.]|nr:hypothetical protein [Acholeplasma sp.]
MEIQYKLIFKHDEVINFLSYLGISSPKIENFKRELKDKNNQTFEQNLKASVPQLLADNGKSIIYKPKNSKTISLRKVKVSPGKVGKSKGYRCYIILDTSSKLIVLTAIYTHQTLASLPNKELNKLKSISDQYQDITEG